MIAAVLLLLSTTALGATGPSLALGPDVNPVISKAQAHQKALAKLRENIFKVSRAMKDTERMIAHSRAAPYLPELQFRLAELYVEKSRYTFFLQAEQRPEGLKGPMVSPETRLLKQKAVQIYKRLLREYPDFEDADKVTFYLAHEQREMGQFDAMIATLGQLITKYPKSPLRPNAELILGDYFFQKSDLKDAETHYQAILSAPRSAVQDLARYKMGWIRVNQGKFAESIPYFEAAAASAPVKGEDAKKALDVKREALLDLVYSYTEVRSGKGAIRYFEKLSDSRQTFALVLDKLGTRYLVKQQFPYAVAALRKLLDIQSDPDMDLERAEKLYDALKSAGGHVPPKPEDVRFLVRAAIEARVDPDTPTPERKKTLAEIELMARDLSTQLQVLAQKQDEQKLYLESAEAYRVYLSLFRPKKYVRGMMKNRADALFAAKAYPKAARQFEELARYEQAAHDKRGVHDALYGALLSDYSTLKQDQVQRFDTFEVADARQALKLLGSKFLARWPRDEHARQVEFNIARAHYDDGEFKPAAQLFTEFALRHPRAKDATVAGNLALDSLRQLDDFKGLEATARKLIASRLPASFIQQVKAILSESKANALTELALKSSEETGDVVTGLLKVAQENPNSSMGEKALYGAFSAAQEKHDLDAQRSVAQKLEKTYPKSHYLPPVMLQMGRQAAQSARFEEAAGWFEKEGAHLGHDASALDGWLAGAKLRLGLGELRRAGTDLESAVPLAGARKAEVLTLLAKSRFEAHLLPQARSAAVQALRADPTQATAAAILAQVVAKSDSHPNVQKLAGRLAKVVNAPTGKSDDSAKALWYLGELLYRQLTRLPASAVDQKVALLQQLEGVYTQAASLGSPQWAVASLWRLGLAYQNLAETVDATPVPAGMTPAQEQQFRAALKAQLDPIRARATSAFQTCVSRADSLQVFSEAALGCRQKSASAQPKLPKPPPATTPSNLDGLRKQVAQKMNAASFEQLGLAFLASGQLGKAKLTLGRALELDDGRAVAHNALGYDLLLEGDPMGARAEYGKALDADPTDAKARVNLAALSCRFGDRQGAKQALAVVKSPASVTGPDVDSGWRACR